MKEYYMKRDAQRAALKEVMKDWSLQDVERAIYLVTDILQEMGVPEASVNDDAKKVVKAAVVENALNGGEQNSIYTSESITVRVKNYYVTSRSYDLRIRGLLGNDKDMIQDDEATQDYDDEEEWLYTEVIVPGPDQPVLEKALENLDYSAISGTVISKE